MATPAPPPPPAPQKEGLESALEFTRFVITVDTALIAFLTGATFLQRIDGLAEKIAVGMVLALLAASIGAGIFVYMRASTMLGQGNYDILDRHLSLPGRWNVLLFAAGAIGVAVLAVVQLLVEPPPAKPAARQIELRCAFADRPHALAHCRGRIAPPAQ
jgi:hypothetical protein